MPSLRFLSLWNEKTGKRFVIVLDEFFGTVREAEEAIRQLSPEYSVSARVLKKWEDGTVFFNRRIVGS